MRSRRGPPRSEVDAMTGSRPGGTLPCSFGGPQAFAPTGREAADFDLWAMGEMRVPERTLMENAGRAAAQIVQRLHPKGPVSVVVGGGNNGGDGVVLARSLTSWGREVRVFRGSRRLPDEGLFHGHALEITESDPEGTPVRQALDRSEGVVVDALLGTGIEGAPRPGAVGWIEAMNQASAPVLSLDLPSGVDAGTGAVPGSAVTAATTVAFGWPKLGSLLYPGRGRAGRIIAVEIGFPPPPLGSFPARVITTGWAEVHRPRRTAPTHKNQVGSLLLLAGVRGLAGAAILAARGALRSGVGYLRVASPAENREILQGSVPGAVFVDAGDAGALARAVEACDAVAAGPGLGLESAAARAMEAVLVSGKGRPSVLAADALKLSANGSVPPLSEWAADRPLVITPHPGEMARIRSVDREELLHRRPEVARAAARELRAPVLLKGDPSLVAAPDGALLVAGTGGTAFAAAGMGDVLTGSTGAFLAQGCEPAVAAGLALHFTGAAARSMDREPALLPEDVVEGLPRALREGGVGWTDLDLPFVTFDQSAPR